MTKGFPFSMLQANTTATANEELTKKGTSRLTRGLRVTGLHGTITVGVVR
jgi:hypothetical protein